MYSNSVLSVWQLTIMAVVPVVLLFGWLIAIFVVSREPGRKNLMAAGSPEGPAVARTSEHEPERPPADRMAT
jgi:hypothetical protein